MPGCLRHSCERQGRWHFRQRTQWWRGWQWRASEGNRIYRIRSRSYASKILANCRPKGCNSLEATSCYTDLPFGRKSLGMLMCSWMSCDHIDTTKEIRISGLHPRFTCILTLTLHGNSGTYNASCSSTLSRANFFSHSLMHIPLMNKSWEKYRFLSLENFSIYRQSSDELSGTIIECVVQYTL